MLYLPELFLREIGFINPSYYLPNQYTLPPAHIGSTFRTVNSNVHLNVKM